MFRKENSSCSTTKPNNKNPNNSSAPPPNNSHKKGGNQKKNAAAAAAAASSNAAALDTPLRKSDIRKLRKSVADFFGVVDRSTTASEAEANTEQTQQQQQQQQQQRINTILEQIFVPNSIATRQLTHAELGKLTLYVRQPSSYHNNNKSKDEKEFDFVCCWPYAVPQVIWISQPPMPNTNHQVEAAVVVVVPTVALLSVLPPGCIPTVWIPSPASKFLCRGAHLMRAGMMNLPQQQQQQQGSTTTFSQNQKSTTTTTTTTTTLAQLKAKKEEERPRVVAICVRGNPQAMAVGLIDPGVQSVADIGVNTRGVGVKVWTCYGDDLWQQQVKQLKACAASVPEKKIMSPIGGQCYNSGNYGNVGFLEGERVLPIVDKNAVAEDDASEDEDEVQLEATAWDVNNNNDLPDEKDGTPEEVPSTPEEGATTNEKQNEDEGDATAPEQSTAEEEEEGEDSLSPEDILHQAVCKALLTSVTPKDLPMLVSNFYANHVLPNRPPNTTVQLKQTKYKKFGNYLQEQVDRGLLTLGTGPNKNTKDKVGYLMTVNKRHEDLLSYKQEHSEEIKEAKAEAQAATGKPNKMVLVNLYMVPHHFVSLLRLDPDAVKATKASSSERAGTGMLTLPEARALLDGYVERENLAQLDEVELDGPLWDALYKKKKVQGEASNDLLTISRKDLAEQWIDAMQPAYGLVEMPGNVVKKLGRGKPPKVQIEVSMRQSRKFVTKIRGMETYGVNGQVLAKDISHRLATQATVETNPEKGAALPKGCVEIVVGGNLADELEALLLGDEKLCPQHGGIKNSDYRLPKNSIDVVLRKGVPARKKKGGGANKKKN